MKHLGALLIRKIFLFFCLLNVPFAEALVFSGLDGLPAFQKRAAQDPALAGVFDRWKDAVNFYIGVGIFRFPTGLAAELNGAGFTVDFSKTQAQLDAQPAVDSTSASSSTNTSSVVDSTPSSTPDSATSTTSTSSASSTSTSSSGSSSTSSSQGTASSGGGNSSAGGGNSPSNGANNSSTNQTTIAGSLKPTQTTFILSPLFGSLIRGVGGVSSSTILGKASKLGGINNSGTRTISSPGSGSGSNSSGGSVGGSPTTNGGSAGSSTGTGESTGSSTGTGGSAGSSTGTGESAGSSTGTGESADNQESAANLNLNVGKILFREYGSSRDVVTNEVRIGVDISEADFLQAVSTSNPTLKAVYEAFKTQSDFRELTQKILFLDPGQDPPTIVLAADNQVDDGLGIHPFYDPGTANELVLGNIGLGDDIEAALATTLHELAHSQQKISFSASEQIYGPDNSHFGTEILTEKVAATEGWSEFWEAYYAPEIWGKLELGLAQCGFRVEDLDSTPLNPKYNGKAASTLLCDDFIPYQELDKNDYFKSEGWFASLLLEVALRVSGSFDLILAAFATSNSESQTTQDIIFALVSSMSTQQRAEFAVIFDVLTAFQLTTAELIAMTLVTQDQIDAYLETRALIQNKANSTVDDEGLPVKYNGFHALDSVQGTPLLPRIDPRAISRGAPKAAVSPDGRLFLAPVKEDFHQFSGRSSENLDFYTKPLNHGEIIRNY